MERIIELECSQKRDNYMILEIGTWAGGSAIVWANAIKRFNDGRGLVICVDPYVQYVQDDLDKPGLYRVMKEALEKGTIISLFLHNIRTSGHEDIVRLIKARSDEILPVFKDNKFDLIYVDGVHTYEQVLKDLQNAAPLLRDGGILCGDDLELQASDVDWENVENSFRFDYIPYAPAKKAFHPGVTLAVAEYFGEVSVWEGFWAMRKRELGNSSNWEKVVVDA
jgi:SAM-dependent methyltransferase